MVRGVVICVSRRMPEVEKKPSTDERCETRKPGDSELKKKASLPH